MTDHTPTTEGNEPDGFVVVHKPKDGSEPYGIGPFPFIESLAEELITATNCDCAKTALSIAFPRGVRVLVGPVDMDDTIDIFKAILEATEAKDEPSDTRLN